MVYRLYRIFLIMSLSFVNRAESQWFLFDFCMWLGMNSDYKRCRGDVFRTSFKRTQKHFSFRELTRYRPMEIKKALNPFYHKKYFLWKMKACLTFIFYQMGKFLSSEAKLFLYLNWAWELLFFKWFTCPKMLFCSYLKSILFASRAANLLSNVQPHFS